MLNELSELYRSLEGHGIAVPMAHASVLSCGKKPFLLIHLSEGGVSSVTAWDVQHMSTYASWTIRDGKHNSFPSVKLDLKGSCPLLAGGPPDESTLMMAKGEALTDKGKKVSVDPSVQCDALKELISYGVSFERVEGWPGYLPRLRERCEELTVLRGTEAESVLRVFDWFVSLSSDPVALFESLFLAIERELPSDDLFRKLVAELVVNGSAQLYFDAATSDEQPVGHVENRGRVAEALFRAEGESGQDGTCMLSGAIGQLYDGNYPQPNLPSLGETYLYSRNRDIPCNPRYGTREQSIDRRLVAKLGGALDEITAGEPGTTWSRLPSEKEGQVDLLLAYLTSGQSVPLATLLAGDDEQPVFEDEDDEPADDGGSWTVFENATRSIINALKAESAYSRPDLRIMVLRRVDPGNRKAIFSRTISADVLLDAAERWQNAFAKRLKPAITVFLPGKKGGKAQRATLRPFPPLRMIGLSRKASRRGGTEIQSVIGLPAAVALDAFCGDEPQAAARRNLARLVKQLGDVASGYAVASRRSPKESHAFDARLALDLLSSLHVLLNILDRPGDVYMSDTAFKLGQFLAGCDTLHLGYCIDQRGGSIPPKLMGNAMMTMAGRNPIRALEVLSRRAPVYTAWATKARNEGRPDPKEIKADNDQRNAWSVRNAMFAPRSLQSLGEELRQSLEGVAPDETFRAELLLGYVAGPDRPDSSGKGAKHEQEETANASA